MEGLRLNENVTIDDIKVLLNQNLKGMVSPHVGQLHNINSKGIYFWFIIVIFFLTNQILFF